MFDTPASGLLPALTGRQTLGCRLVSPVSPGTGGGRGAAFSAVLHAAAALLLGRLLWGTPPMPPEAGMPITMVFAPQQTSPANQQAAPPQAMAAPVPAPQAAPAKAVPAQSSAAPPRRPHQVRRLQPMRSAPDASPTRSALPTPPAAPAAVQAPALEQPAMPDAATLAGFTRQVQTAVQAAALYPPVARRMSAQGRVQVRFDYSGGAVSGVIVAVPGPLPMLDRAALAAVRTASYPPAPASFGRARLPMVVWVDFHLQGDG